MDVADMMSCEDSAAVSTVALQKTCDRRCRRSSSCRKEGKEKRSCGEEVMKCELVGYDSLPSYLKDNEFILSYYRSEWPLRETVLSIFSVHNETLNVWTHLIGFFMFLALTICAAMMVPRDDNAAPAVRFSQDMLMGFDPGMMQQQGLLSKPNISDFARVGVIKTSPPASSADTLPPLPGRRLHEVPTGGFSVSFYPQANYTEEEDTADDDAAVLRVQPVSRWPFFAFLCGAMLCLLTSSLCHLLMCHSEHFSCAMLRLDYTGISTLIVTSFYPLVYYTFMCDPFYRNLYIGFITAFGVATVMVSLVPAFQTPGCRPVRAGLFFCMGVSGLVPIMHKLVAFGHRPEALVTTGYELVMGAFYGLGVVVYATRVPERWMPGKFDLVGHSHQLFHVLVIAGAYTHYLAGLVYLQWRDMDSC